MVFESQQLLLCLQYAFLKSAKSQIDTIGHKWNHPIFLSLLSSIGTEEIMFQRAITEKLHFKNFTLKKIHFMNNPFLNSHFKFTFWNSLIGIHFFKFTYWNSLIEIHFLKFLFEISFWNFFLKFNFQNSFIETHYLLTKFTKSKCIINKNRPPLKNLLNKYF